MSKAGLAHTLGECEEGGVARSRLGLLVLSWRCRAFVGALR